MAWVTFSGCLVLVLSCWVCRSFSLLGLYSEQDSSWKVPWQVGGSGQGSPIETYLGDEEPGRSSSPYCYFPLCLSFTFPSFSYPQSTAI